MAPPYSVLRLEVVPSTQDVARGSYAGNPLLVVADRQEQGRGRSGSSWENADRAVALSLAFQPPWPQQRWGVVPLTAGVLIGRLTGCDLKWPNDVVVEDEKAGGILVETAGTGPVVVGVGLNLWWPRPPEGMAGLYEVDPGPGEAERIAADFARMLLEVTSRPIDEWPRDEYLARCVTLGRRVRWEPDGTGTATGIAHDGGLIVSTARGIEVLHSGEVRHVR